MLPGERSPDSMAGFMTEPGVGGVADGDAGVVELRTPSMRLRVDVRRGAKVTALTDLVNEREWLVPGPSGATPLPQYGDGFTDQPLYGWDEMFPTVDACHGLAEPFSDVHLPDHGEVWSRAWRVDECTSTVLECSIDGRALPYRLSRRLEVTGSTVVLEYSAQTSAPTSVPVLWAAHPQLEARSGTALRLPSAVTSLGAISEGTPEPERFAVPVPAAGVQCQPLVAPGTGLMLYADPSLALDRATLVDPGGTWLRMGWDACEVPYFAAWMDNGLYASAPVICPEPTTGYVDSLVEAEGSGRVAHARAGERLRWTLELSLGRS